MDAWQFYPTPKALAERAWALFKNRSFTRVLEPSAGDGALVDAHPWNDERYYRGTRPIIDCCEIDVTKHATLRSKGYNVVGLDFLQFGNASIYSTVILNPPFNYGAAHVLKAYEAIWDGEIVAIINAETVLNPFSLERQRLVDLIEQFGSYEIIEGAFAVPDADRKSAVALPNSFIENSVITLNAAVSAMRDSVRSEARARHYAAMLGDTMAVHCGAQGSSSADYTTDWVKSELGQRYDELKDRAWANLLRSSDVTSRLSSAAQKRLEREFDQIKKLEYTVANVQGFLCGLVDSQGQIQEDMICDVFDLIGKYHWDNVTLAMGWKSNSKHRTLAMKVKATRFILPGHGTEPWQTGLSWDSERLLSDFDKAFSLLEGVPQPEISLVSIFRNHFKALCDGKRIYGSHFSVRYWPSAGTIHFFPTRPDLIDRLNRVVGRKRAWLPPVDTMATDAFWSAYDKSEKFDKEVAKEIAKHRRSWWDNPFDNLRDEGRREAAENQILDAIGTVLERNGIRVDNLLADATPAHPQLELLAA